MPLRSVRAGRTLGVGTTPRDAASSARFGGKPAPPSLSFSQPAGLTSLPADAQTGGEATRRRGDRRTVALPHSQRPVSAGFQASARTRAVQAPAGQSRVAARGAQEARAPRAGADPPGRRHAGP